MVNEQEEIKLGYLLDPCFELSNTAGKPLTNGWIEVYIHGTRNKYYCYSDFGGTLHPFKIPLDSLGSNIVLADPERAYDVYVYNHFGSLVMSRYNVSPGHAGGAAISSGGNAEHWIGRYGATIPVAANEYSDNIPLPIEPDYEGTFIDHISDNKNIVLKDGLYLVDCLLSFRQNPDSLNNTLGYVHVFTGLDDGESGVFQRNETLPDTDPDELHNIRVQFVRHVEGSTGCNVCFQVRTTNAWSFVRIQSLSIVKLGASGGIAPQPIEYDAGQYISIDGDVISVTGVQPAGNYADASSVSQGFYDVNQQLNALSGQINEVSGQIPSLDGYATETWVNDQGFLKEVPSEFVTESELNSAISGKADKSEIPSLEGYATEEWVRQQNYLTEVPDNYATDQEVQAAVSGKADKSEIPSLDGYATEEWVGQQGYLTSVPSEYITETELESELSGKADVSAIPSVAGLASETYVDQKVEEATSGKADVSAIPSLNGYATESWVSEQGYLTEVPAGYATTEDVESATSGKMDASEASAFYPMASNPSGYLTQHQSLSGYATEQYVQDQTSGFVDSGFVSDYVDGAVSGKQDQLEFGYTSGGSVSAINNSGIYDAQLNEFVNQNSGAWGGEALPVSGGPGIKFRMDNGTLIAELDRTVLWSGDATPNGQTSVGQLSEPISAFSEYEVYCTFETMYPPKVNKFSLPSEWESNQPNTNIKFGGICESVSWKPTENDNVMHAFISIGFGSNLRDLYILSGCNIDCGSPNGSTASRNNNYGPSLYHVTKVVGINRVGGN